MSAARTTSSERSSSNKTAIAIMAAGKGTRLKSKHPKVLHEVGGKPLLAHVIEAATKIVPAKNVYAIIGHEADRVREALHHTGVNFVVQEPQRGTGHALMVAREALSPYDHVIVLSGDAPLITPQTIEKLRDFHLDQKAAMTMLTAGLENPTGYGRILRKGAGNEVKTIVEEKSATPAQRKIREINSGIYAFSTRALFDNIDNLTTDNPHQEFYLTDMAAVLAKAKHKVVALKTENPGEILGSNTRREMVELDSRLRLAKCHQLMAEGVTIFQPQTCIIDNDVQIGADTTIEPFVQILGKTRIGADCRIRSYSVINDSEIADGVLIQPGSVVDNARIANAAVIGPVSHLRPETEIGEGAHVGAFVQTKKIRMGKGSKANHLAYLGDADIGENVNLGAGTITCNYDGVNKHVTTIENGAFIGSDATLVAPVRIGQGAYVAAASCITQDVPAESLALGRARQTVKEGWARTKRQEKASPKTK
jgi:bifunctional UDP-N-acetylglucosamine pyrophosphorylase / glucosamine-1-phosphate N-acetyltransferase